MDLSIQDMSRIIGEKKDKLSHYENQIARGFWKREAVEGLMKRLTAQINFFETLKKEKETNLENEIVNYSTAVIIRAGRPVAQVVTNGKNGEVVRYGYKLIDNNFDANRAKDLIVVGEGKISRAKKYLEDNDLIYSLEDGYCEGDTAELKVNEEEKASWTTRPFGS